MENENQEIIQFYNEDCDFSLKSESDYQKWISNVASYHKCHIKQLNYIFASDEYVLDLNKNYLDHDYYTDILSFPLAKDPIEGDIFISIDRVIDNAKTLDLSFDDELKRVMAHGLLHFIGFDDHTKIAKHEMRMQEEKAMTLFADS